MEPGTIDYCGRAWLDAALFSFCDLRKRPQAYRAFLQGRMLPQEEVLIRRDMKLGSFVRGAESPRTTFKPYVDEQYDVAGWRYYDANSQGAMLILGIDGWLTISLTKRPATGLEELDAVIHHRFDFGRPEQSLRLAVAAARPR